MRTEPQAPLGLATRQHLGALPSHTSLITHDSSLRPLRILYALNSYRPVIDGVSVARERQALLMARRGHHVALVAPGERFEDYEERCGEHDDVCVFRLRAVPAFWRYRIALVPGQGVRRVMDAFDPDVVVVSLPTFLNRSAWSLARRRGIAVVGITGMMPSWVWYHVPLLRPFARQLDGPAWRAITHYYDRCAHVVGVSRTALRYLTDYGLRAAASVIPDGVDLSAFQPRRRDAHLARRLGIPDKPVVLYTGRLDAEKGLDVWVRAIPDVLRVVDAHFVLNGDGARVGALRRLVRKLGVEAHVTFTGDFLPYDEYPRLYSLADVFAIASPTELYSVVTAEAMASGLPVVGARAGALPELIDHGRNGYLFPPGDYAVLASYLIALLRDAALRRQMALAARCVAEAHDIHRTALSYEKLYRSVVATGERVAMAGA